MSIKPEVISPAQALALAALVLDFETETAHRARNVAWARETQAAAAVIRQLAGPPVEVCTVESPGGNHPLSGR
jgi:hypothetical protein